MPVGDITSAARGSGARYNDGKPPMELIPLEFIAVAYSRGKTNASVGMACDVLSAVGDYQTRRGGVEALYAALEVMGQPWRECAQVYGYGARKYAQFNWMKGMNWSVPIACIARHALAIIDGEENDPESGLPHVGHIACNIVMLLWFAEHYPEGDDRMPAAAL